MTATAPATAGRGPKREDRLEPGGSDVADPSARALPTVPGSAPTPGLSRQGQPPAPGLRPCIELGTQEGAQHVVHCERFHAQKTEVLRLEDVPAVHAGEEPGDEVPHVVDFVPAC